MPVPVSGSIEVAMPAGRPDCLVTVVLDGDDIVDAARGADQTGTRSVPPDVPLDRLEEHAAAGVGAVAALDADLERVGDRRRVGDGAQRRTREGRRDQDVDGAVGRHADLATG